MTPPVIIIGGGIAATTCAEYLSQECPHTPVLLITACDVVKTASSLKKVTRAADELEVKQVASAVFQNSLDHVSLKIGVVQQINAEEHTVQLDDGSTHSYSKLCICTGAIPLVPSSLKEHPSVICIRDTDTARDLEQRLSKAKKVIVIGNGGIALELVYEIFNCKIVWCIRFKHIGSTFFDKGAATFLLSSLNESTDKTKAETIVFKRRKYVTEREKLNQSTISGSALGPDWSMQRKLSGACDTQQTRDVEIKWNCEDIEVLPYDSTRGSNVQVQLKNGEVVEGDLVVYVTGVQAKIPCFKTKNIEAPISVDNNMRTEFNDVYAAGDCCNVSWNASVHWFQMCLWTQAWQQGAYAGKCIANHLNNEPDMSVDFCFELFTHITTFFGFKVCLLGCYNAQNISSQPYEFMLRCTKGIEYVKLVMLNGRVQGAILIGETDLEETIENLIINAIDVGFLGTSLLDPDVDIEDYFD